MKWKSIRLELGRTSEFPDGSASRAYLLRLPTDEAGLIDEAELRSLPAHATVRRFWPNEPDQAGYVIRTRNGWALSYRKGEEDDEAIFHLETHPILAGEYITLTEPDGTRLPFRVASVTEVDGASSSKVFRALRPFPRQRRSEARSTSWRH